MIKNLKVHSGLVLGQGANLITVEKINSENIYLRLTNNSSCRIIPTKVVLDILNPLVRGDISLQDISRDYRKKNNLTPLFEALELDYDKFILGYEATISKICEYELEHFSDNTVLARPTTLPKPFLLLAGISGTGKTRFVREQAKRFTASLSNYCLISVRPDWHEPSDLLGYISRIGAEGVRYIVTDFLRFMVQAWKNINSDKIMPYWLCLDEMNLAPVEQYFADYLSIIETRHWDNGEYQCDAIVSDNIFQNLDDEGIAALRADLDIAGDEHNALWSQFEEKGIRIPYNLIVAGTVNMDETTHGFSRKVIDRAFTLDFGEFYPNNYAEFFEPKTQAITLSYPLISQANLDHLSEAAVDTDGQKSIDFLESINSQLKQTPFELAYRALNELLIAVASYKPENEIALQSVWDDFLMTKVLPRIEGDAEKLADDGETNLLKALEQILAKQLNAIWGNESRLDLLRKNINDDPLTIACRSQKKLAWMQQRLEANGFTSFWP